MIDRHNAEIDKHHTTVMNRDELKRLIEEEFERDCRGRLVMDELLMAVLGINPRG